MFCGVNSGNDNRNLDFDACRIVDLHGEKKCDDNNIIHYKSPLKLSTDFKKLINTKNDGSVICLKMPELKHFSTIYEKIPYNFNISKSTNSINDYLLFYVEMLNKAISGDIYGADLHELK